MLIAAGQSGDAGRCRALGITASPVKPLMQAELLDALLTALGMPSEAPPVVTRPSVHDSRGTLRVLLAEDNRVNQVVAARLLSKRGHTVVTVGNGREALAALDDPGGGEFDLILMDVQMPEMDGCEATGIIRAREKSSRTR